MRNFSQILDNQRNCIHLFSFILAAFGFGLIFFSKVSAEKLSSNASPTNQRLFNTPVKYPDKQTATPAPTRFPNSPDDFLLVDAAPGVQLFRKDYPNGSPDFVQVIDLSQGARLDLLYGEIVEPRPEKGAYGHADPRMTSLPIQSYWQKVTAVEKNTFCVTNGAFFYMPEYPTRLAFPLKVDGDFVTDGFGINTYIGQKLILELWEDHAQIRELGESSLNRSSASDIIGGLTEEANKRAKYSVGRTFLGITDRDGDGSAETILLLTTETALQTSAASSLRSFGAREIMMLDGGGSTQLLCRKGHYIDSDRPIPQAIAVIASVPPPVSSKAINIPSWPVLLEGEPFELNLEMQNTGISTWNPLSTQFSLQSNVLSEHTLISIPKEVEPGERVVITQTLASFSQNGVYPVRISWGIMHQGKLYHGDSFEFQAVVIPTALSENQAELEENIREWSSKQPDDVKKLVVDWIDSQKEPSPTSMDTNTVQQSIQISNAAIIPLLMLPVLIILAALIGRMRR